VGRVKSGPEAVRDGRASTGSSFHYSFGLLPHDQRRGIEAVYAFCRAIDDVVDDEPIDPVRAAATLSTYREEVARCYGGSPSLPVTRGLQEWIERFHIPRQPLLDLLAGVEMDLHTVRFDTFDDLKVYCRRVASAVGLICLSIFGCRHAGSHDYAIDLGIALQLTNILRDLKGDAARGRIYIPRDEMASFGYTEDDLIRGERGEAFLALMRHQAERARQYFAAAARALPAEERPRLLAAEVMAAIYRRLLARIEADGFRVFDRRIAVPRITQFAVALRARALGRAGP
jgi:phytoene synthase